VPRTTTCTRTSAWAAPVPGPGLPALPHTLCRPDHVYLVCQLEFTSLPIRPSARFKWTIGKVLDRGFPKLCVPTSLDALDPAMREQFRVTVAGLRQPRADKLHVRAALPPPPPHPLPITSVTTVLHGANIRCRLQALMLCPQGLGTPAGEATPARMCPMCAGNLLRGARNPPRLSLANNVIDARSPQLDGAWCRRSHHVAAHTR